jgi:hypothetical protein
MEGEFTAQTSGEPQSFSLYTMDWLWFSAALARTKQILKYKTGFTPLRSGLHSPRTEAVFGDVLKLLTPVHDLLSGEEAIPPLWGCSPSGWDSCQTLNQNLEFFSPRNCGSP